METFNHGEYISICLQGDYNKIIAYLRAADDGAELLAKYEDIFENNVYVLITDDEDINAFLNIYEDFIKWVLKTAPTRTDAEYEIVKRLMPLFPQAGLDTMISKDQAYTLLEELVPKFLKEHGFYAQFGTVSPYPSLSLWGKQTVRHEQIDLPDGYIDMEVVEMDDVITRGWLDYLTLTEVGTGGWVTNQGCTYFKKYYDTDSDTFKVGLLKHEGQHFFDKKKYPKMESTDLEYRAKLVELIYTKDLNIFFHFLRNMSATDDRSFPHAYAERKIIQGLSHKILDTELEINADVWASKSDKIQSAASALFNEHSQLLAAQNGLGHII